MDGDVKAEIKTEVKTEPIDITTPLKDEAVDDDEYVVPPKRLRRNQGSILCCAIFREIEAYLKLVSVLVVLQKWQWQEIVLSLIPLTGWLFNMQYYISY